MSDYPEGIDDFRERSNIPGQEFDEDKTTTLYNEDLVAVEDSVIAIEETLGLEPQGSSETVGERLDGMDESIVDIEEQLPDLATEDYVDNKVTIHSSSTPVLTNDLDLDDYPIYKKVIVGTFTASASATTNIAHGIASLRSVEAIQCLYRFGSSTITNAGIIGGHREGGGNWSNMVEFNSTNVFYYGTYAWGTSAFKITIYYTVTA